MPFAAVDWRVRTQTLTNADHTLIMGVLNVTPDSFSDGGRFATSSDAIAAGLHLRTSGADIVDVGGESTRPGAFPVDSDEELERVAPVVAGLAAEGVVVSIDTSKPVVAAAAVAHGAEIVNDVTGLRSPEMRHIVADTAVGAVVMHMRGTPATMQVDPQYNEVVSDVRTELAAAMDAAVAAGVDAAALCADPGIGFGKTLEHNLQLLAGLEELVGLGVPVLVGASRKGFLGAILDAAGHGAPADGRDAATAATTVRAITAGAMAVRAHNVASTLQVARVADAIVRAHSAQKSG